MINKINISKTISQIIHKGIDLSPLKVDESVEYFYRLASYINDEGAYNAHLEKNKITIETFFYDPLLAIYLDKTSIQFIPISDSGWLDPLLIIIKFIRIEHMKDIENIEKRRKHRKKEEKEFEWI